MAEAHNAMIMKNILNNSQRLGGPQSIGLACLLIALFSLPIKSDAQGAYVGTAVTKITLLDSYNQYGDGDVRILVQTPPSSAGCDGFWITKADAGFQANLSMLLAAYHAGTQVVIYGLPGQLWAGSGAKICKLYSVEYH
jgi:hypothetical protein